MLPWEAVFGLSKHHIVLLMSFFLVGINLQLLVEQRPKHVTNALDSRVNKKWKWKSNLTAVIRELQDMPLTFQGD